MKPAPINKVSTNGVKWTIDPPDPVDHAVPIRWLNPGTLFRLADGETPCVYLGKQRRHSYTYLHRQPPDVVPAGERHTPEVCDGDKLVVILHLIEASFTEIRIAQRVVEG